MQLGIVFSRQPGIAQASLYQGFAGTAGFITPGQGPEAQAHQAHGMGGLLGAGALGPAGGAQTPKQQGIQGTGGGLVAGTMAMTTAGRGGQATI
jgi:hypothetical protein